MVVLPVEDADVLEDDRRAAALGRGRRGGPGWVVAGPPTIATLVLMPSGTWPNQRKLPASGSLVFFVSGSSGGL